VMHAGTNVLTLPVAEATEERLLSSCFGYGHTLQGGECVETRPEP